VEAMAIGAGRRVLIAFGQGRTMPSRRNRPRCDNREHRSPTVALKFLPAFLEGMDTAVAILTGQVGLDGMDIPSVPGRNIPVAGAALNGCGRLHPRSYVVAIHNASMAARTTRVTVNRYN
jgi:hypothetical protein